MPSLFSNCEEHTPLPPPRRGSGLLRKGVPARTQQGPGDALAAVWVETRWGRVKGGRGTEMNVKSNESPSARVLKFFESAHIPGTTLGLCSFTRSESPGTWKWNFVFCSSPPPRRAQRRGEQNSGSLEAVVPGLAARWVAQDNPF